ncbi:PQQ-binding-like beta-propeller repeat protein [Natronococcus sp. A-GB1]|uniref:outer membrane protein assembly factor BamB family protein n=1 Tax=Natronococcus sp. A-GB1 TaxID=3037648 RepID=UPI00241FD439|nr:PQQ-binding-like beta-propeller repeat protein [Natronococcus sp. A-GB1]MDG5758530.1 PQQ-binding-like beta-propeller repeat protein [Natronococcus sp. A-GB1]
MPSRRAVLATGASAGLAAVAGCLSSGHSFGTLETDPDSWRLSRFDLQNTGHNADATVPDDPEERWRVELESPGRDVAGLVVGEDVVVVGSEEEADRSLVALERDDGDVRWEDEDADVAAIALGDETVYATAEDGDVAAYDLGTGERDWEIAGESGSTSHGVWLRFDGETLYRGDDGRLTAYDTDSGDERWHRSGYGASAIDGDRLLRGNTGLTAYGSPTESVRFDDGGPEPRWEASERGHGTFPVVWEDRILVGARYWPLDDDSARLQAHRLDDGELEWELEFPGAYVTSPVIVGERAIFHVGRGGWDDDPDGPSMLMAVDREGTIDWELETEWERPTLAAVGEMVLVGGDADDTDLVAIDPTDGERRWERGLQGDSVQVASVSALAPVDGELFVGTGHSHVVAYG